MNGLLFLTTNDFIVNKGSKGNVLCNKLSGLSLILFYSTQCSHCQKTIPLFKQLPSTMGGCQFGMINISNNKDIIRISKSTINAIQYVPCIYLYVDGTCFMRYDGPMELNEIKAFIMDVANKIQTKQKFSKEKVKVEEVPAYSLGKPLGTEGKNSVCYLNFDSAYKPEN